MIFQVKHSGQLCNRLFSLLPSVSYAMHCKQKLVVLFESKQYLDYFDNIGMCPYVRFAFVKANEESSHFERAVIRIGERRDLFMEEDFRNVRDLPRIVFIDGWQHCLDTSYVMEERSALLELFRPRKGFILNVEEQLAGFDGITIGVHIRRGDYLVWCPNLYYDDETYMTAMRVLSEEIHARFGSGIKVRFLICTNDRFDIRPDFGAQVIQLRPCFQGDCMSDLYGLSKCDYIIGPPSSFSQWASWYGNVPIRFMRGGNDAIKLSEFSPIVRMNRTEMGYDSFFYEEKNHRISMK